MGKKYNHNPESKIGLSQKTEKNEIQEPALEYKTNTPLVSPCQYTVEELQQRVLTATKHVEEGKYYTDEELDDFVLS